MNVMGELASLLGLSALAGVIIGWCIRNFFGGSAKTKRQYAARDADEAVKDARHLRRVLNNKENDHKTFSTLFWRVTRGPLKIFVYFNIFQTTQNAKLAYSQFFPLMRFTEK